METLESPQYRPFQGCHVGTPPTCIGMDARWGVAAVCKEESRREPDPSSGSTLALFRTASHSLSYLGLQRDSLIFIHVGLYTEISKGYVSMFVSHTLFKMS